MSINLVYVLLENICLFRKYGTSHDLKGIHRKIWIALVITDVVFFQEPLGFDTLIFPFIFDPFQRDGWGNVVCSFKHASKKNGYVFKLNSGSLLYFWNDEMGQIGVWTAKIEKELSFH